MEDNLSSRVSVRGCACPRVVIVQDQEMSLGRGDLYSPSSSHTGLLEVAYSSHSRVFLLSLPSASNAFPSPFHCLLPYSFRSWQKQHFLREVSCDSLPPNLNDDSYYFYFLLPSSFPFQHKYICVYANL